jgi:hypothetical protein
MRASAQAGWSSVASDREVGFHSRQAHVLLLVACVTTSAPVSSADCVHAVRARWKDGARF